MGADTNRLRRVRRPIWRGAAKGAECMGRSPGSGREGGGAASTPASYGEGRACPAPPVGGAEHTWSAKTLEAELGRGSPVGLRAGGEGGGGEDREPEAHPRDGLPVHDVAVGHHLGNRRGEAG